MSDTILGNLRLKVDRMPAVYSVRQITPKNGMIKSKIKMTGEDKKFHDLACCLGSPRDDVSRLIDIELAYRQTFLDSQTSRPID